eukprot:Opistho-1_new@45725
MRLARRLRTTGRSRYVRVVLVPLNVRASAVCVCLCASVHMNVWHFVAHNTRAYSPFVRCLTRALALQVESRQATMRADKTAESSPANCLQLRKQYSQRTPQQERQLWAFRRMVNAGLFFKA